MWLFFCFIKDYSQYHFYIGFRGGGRGAIETVPARESLCRLNIKKRAQHMESDWSISSEEM